MVKCNQKMYDTISDYDFARIREGLGIGVVSFQAKTGCVCNGEVNDLLPQNFMVPPPLQELRD